MFFSFYIGFIDYLVNWVLPILFVAVRDVPSVLFVKLTITCVLVSNLVSISHLIYLIFPFLLFLFGGLVSG